MSSVCMSNDARDPRVPVRATYVNLYKWPESDAEFVRSVSSRGVPVGSGRFGHPRVVDSISCRQMYLRSYKFSRDQDTHNDHNTNLCFGRLRHKRKKEDKKKCLFLGKLKDFSFAVFRRCLSCTATVDVVDHRDC